MSPLFPFSAVVGQDDAKLALVLATVDRRIGGVLLRGQKGSAKTTLARGLAALLAGDAPFVELPLGATEDRVVGSIDLAAALTGGEVRFQPGLLAQAHGGVLHVDEVNLLADHLVDVLLDVATSGINRVEREGLSHSHPSRFVLIGSMNPEEGDLRPQLLDRFGLAVDVVAPGDPVQRVEAVRRRLAFDADPLAAAASWAGEDSDLSRRLHGCQPASLPDEVMAKASAVCASVGAEGLRADLVLCRAAAALAGWDGRDSATVADLQRVAALALGHRRRRGPLDGGGIEAGRLDDAFDEPPSDSHGTESDRAEGGGVEGGGPAAGGGPAGASSGEPGERAPSPARDPADPDSPREVARLEVAGRNGDGDGGRSLVETTRGRLVGDRRPEGNIASVAVGATVRAAAVRTASTGGRAPGSRGAPAIEPGDLREAVRRERTANLVILAVDASGSMGAPRRMEAAKGAVMSLLIDAYQRRDRVALITFGGAGAQVVLRPTSSVEVARARLKDLPTGGRTPLAAGITAAAELAEAEALRKTHEPLIVMITDGRATAGPDGTDPLTAAREAAAALRRRKIAAAVVDAEEGHTRLGLALELAGLMGARYLTLSDLSGVALGLG